MNTNLAVSPTRTYIADCNKHNFKGHYFKKFVLPNGVPNTSAHAAWYFLNRVDLTACINGCFTAEDFANVTDVVPFWENKDAGNESSS